MPTFSGDALQSLLGSHLAGFELRPDQGRMIAAVEAAIRERRDLCVEAGTGTGKTLAYLLPILAAGHKAIIATATRQLQSQLLEHDVPVAVAATGARIVAAALKGRANYLCLHRLSASLRRHALASPGPLLRLEQLARVSATGEIAEASDIDEHDPVWPGVTSTVDNCAGGECPAYEDCFVVAARRRALAADLLIVNHHLLLADYALRERFDGAILLPAADVIVIDEAHALPDVATAFFGRTVSSGRVARLFADLADLAAELGGEAGRAVGEVADGLRRGARALLDAAAGPLGHEPLDAPRLAALRSPARALCARLEADLVALGRRQVAAAGPGVPRAREALASLRHDLHDILGDGDDPECPSSVRWIERGRRSTALLSRPAQTGPLLRRTLLAEPAVRVFTSATLALGADFSAFFGAVGLPDDGPALRLAGGFDYAEQALLYLPRHLPRPFAQGRERAVAVEIGRLCRLSGGGALALFTSRRAMRDAHERLGERLPMTILCQGESSRERLLRRFSREQPAVLFATMGFWQGVDLPGDTLRLVILDKVPFPPPDDPLFAARSARLEAAGHSSFARLSMPAAATALRQGFGRLIRRRSDRGVVAILDPRLSRMPYGRRLIAALPPARRTSAWSEIEDFFAHGAPGDPEV